MKPSIVENLNQNAVNTQILRALFPVGIQPDQYERAILALQIGSKILNSLTLQGGDLPLSSVPLTANVVGTSVTVATAPARAASAAATTAHTNGSGTSSETTSTIGTGLSAGAQKVLDLIKAKPRTVDELAKTTKFNRGYVYLLVKQVKDQLGAKLHVERQGREKHYSLSA